VFTSVLEDNQALQCTPSNDTITRLITRFNRTLLNSVMATSEACYPDLVETERTIMHLDGLVIHIIGPVPKTAHGSGPICNLCLK
jgi:hypothetical protein